MTGETTPADSSGDQVWAAASLPGSPVTLNSRVIARTSPTAAATALGMAVIEEDGEEQGNG